MRLILTIIILVFAVPSIACKVRSEPATYPLSDLKVFEEVVVVRALSADQGNSGRYSMTREVTVEVKRTLKGSLKAGESFTAVHVKEEAHAVCPVFLRVGDSYLIPLRSEGKSYSYSRFSLIVPSVNKKFPGYVADIENGI